MATLSLLDKLSILFEVSKSSNLFIFAILIILFLGVVLFTTNKKNAKTSRKLFIALYVFILISAFVLYRNSLTNMIDYLMNNLFIVVYFPNLAVYLSAIVISAVITWVSVFNFKTSKIIKSINIVVYTIISYLMFILLSIINQKNLDVFNQNSIYGNRNAQAIIELTSLIFIVWIIFLLLYKAIRLFQTKDDKEEKPVQVVQQNNIRSVMVKRRLPKTTKEVQHPETIKVASPLTHNEIRANEELEKYQNLFTLEDYKVMISLLKEKKLKEQQEKLRKEREDKELAKFRELQDLYRLR